MMSFTVDTLLYQVANIFLWPAITLILAALFFSLFSLGSILIEIFYRSRGQYQTELTHYANQSGIALDDLELWIIHRLELFRLTSRVAPLLGMVATLIPLGPALLALSENDTASIGQNMVIAFSGVTLALIAASISFVILNIRRRWLFEELRTIEKSASFNGELA